MNEMRYRIERTKNRTSRAVVHEGTVLIRLARGLPPPEEKRHIDSLLRRMAKVYAKEVVKIHIDPFGPLLRGSEIVHINLASGSTLSISVRNGRKTKALRVANGWSVLRGIGTDDRTFKRYLWKLVSLSAQKETEALVRSINSKTLRVPVRDVTVKFMRSRWGSCSTAGSIALSAPLLLTTPEIMHYVVIHELAHRLRPDHSAAFWREVMAHEPEYKALIKKLRNYTLQGV